MFRNFFWALMLYLGISSSVLADTLKHDTEHLTLRIIPEFTTISPETSKITFLFEGKIQPQWHIYWDNPGDSGDPTTLIAKDTPYYEKIEESHSAPKKSVYEQIITSYFHHSTFYFKTTYALSQPVNLKELPFSFNFTYTACQESCFTESIIQNLDIPVLKAEQKNPEFDVLITESEKLFPVPIQASIQINGSILRLKIDDSIFQNCPEAEFVSQYPKRNILADLPITQKNNEGFLEVNFNEDELPTDFKGVLLCGQNSYFVQPTQIQAPIPAKNPSDTNKLFYYILTAFIAGLILNLMPCVLPILGLKALYLVQHKEQSSVISALEYFFGVICSFLLLAGILYYLRANGNAVGWGFQLQSPVFNSVLLLLFFVIFLNLTEKLPIPEVYIDTLSKISDKQSFLTGFFAVIIACPCTGPFMGAALGYAITQPAIIYFAIFSALGTGYALPYTLIEIFPQYCLKFIPKPGHWILVMKRILSIPIALTCLWLGWIIYNQMHPFSSSTDEIEWTTYSHQDVEEAIKNNESVFINFTAKWCLVCLVNEKTTLSSVQFMTLAKAKNIRLFKADWTNRDEHIREALKTYGRNSIPLYVYYSQGSKEPIILPQILTTNILKQIFK